MMSRKVPYKPPIASAPETPQPGRYVPPEHSGCAALRDPTKRYAEVQHTETVNATDAVIVTRYCYCRYCGERYKIVVTTKHEKI